MTNRRDKERPRVFSWLGDLSAMRVFLQQKPWLSVWGPVKITNSVLRSLGVIAFANNPLTGLLILVGMFVGNPSVGYAALLTGSIAVLTSKALGAPDGLVCDGVTVFNSVLMGCVVTAVFPHTQLTADDALHYWLAIAAASVITCYVDLGLNALMAPTGLPAQSLAFNFVAAVGLLAVRGKQLGHGLHDVTAAAAEAAAADAAFNATSNSLYAPEDHNVDWFKVMEGTVLAVGEVYGVGSMTPSILIWLGFLLYSPILSCCFYVGSLIGCCMGVVLSPGPLSQVYAGLWGYNSLLVAGGLSYFLRPSLNMLAAVTIGALMTVFVQAAVLPLFLQTEVPVFSFPFNIVVITVLAIGTQKGTALTFLVDRSFHEQHLYEAYCGPSQVQDCADTDLERNLNAS
uniref:Urea transporter 2-like n=1 Tax=Hirondellea gigas TaxID=1518452 RepID=A0A6A7GFM4_9CRUS